MIVLEIFKKFQTSPWKKIIKNLYILEINNSWAPN